MDDPPEEEGSFPTLVRTPDDGPFAVSPSALPPGPGASAGVGASAGGADGGRGLVVIGAGSVFAGRYRIRHKIARGGMSTVWEAVDERIDRQVALKLMSPHLADEPEYCTRFEQEAKAAARLASPYVVALYDYGLHEGLPFMVLERLVGEDLHKRTKRVGSIGPEATERVVEQAAAALHAAHRGGIVHRDVKPHNLFLADVDGEEVVKLLDFGVAKHAGTAALRTRTGIMVGSPHFMSPEQVRGARQVDARSDLFSLGAVAYLCLTGRTPFVGGMPGVFLAILEGRPPAATSLRPELPPAVDRFFARALALEPRDRFATAVELSAALRDALASGPARAAAPVSALHPVRPPERGKPRFVVEDDEPPRPSEFPTAISPVPDEVLQRGSAPTLAPPPGFVLEALVGPPSGPDRGTPTPREGRLRASPTLPIPVADLPPVLFERSVIVDEALLAPGSSPSSRTPEPAAHAAAEPPPSARGGGPGFSIAMRSYQPSVWAEPPRVRVAPRERLRTAVPLVLASMAGFVIAVALLVVVWALLG